MSTPITDLPREILFQILTHIPPHLTPAVLLTCRTFNNVAEPRLWRYHCRTQFRYWSQEHGIHNQLVGNTDLVDWKTIFSDRYMTDRKASACLDDIIESQSGRIEKAEKILAFGYDAKDTLLRHLHVSDDADDVLARRYYANAIIRSLHAKMAIHEWANIHRDGSASLERVLTAFDMFVLGDGAGDFDYVSTRLDSLACSVVSETSDFKHLTSRQKARAISAYLAERCLTGVEKDEDYHALESNFIGLALQDKDQPSLSTVSVAIYCSVAQRLGLHAYPCGFPFSVLTIIKPSVGFDMDERVIQSTEEARPMYLDPLTPDQELSVSDLQGLLAAMGVSTSKYGTLLDSSPAIEMVRRTAMNILNVVQKQPHIGHGASPGSTSIDAASAFYGALWALLILSNSSEIYSMQRTRCLPYVMEQLQNQFFMDVGLAEHYILPTFESRRLSVPVADTIRLIRASESEPKLVKWRDGRTNVKYRVGQVFNHIRYHYQAVIIGWDIECGATEQWMSRMNVDSLSYGRHQSFYHVLVEDSSTRYVAEENIHLQHPDVPSLELMELAGRFFKRWDRSRKKFVSNIKDEYPDD